MSDLIDRGQAMDALIDYGKYLWERFHEPCHLAGMLDAIENVPSAQPEKQWIPVTERMPNKDGRFLVQDEDGGIGVMWCTNTNPFWRDLRTDWYWLEETQYSKIVAWQPLPEPWKGENDG